MMEMENGELENHRQLMKSVVEQVGLLRQATQASLILLKGLEILHNTQQPAARFLSKTPHTQVTSTGASAVASACSSVVDSASARWTAIEGAPAENMATTELCSLKDENLPLSLAVFVLKLCAVRMVPVFPSVSDMVSVMPIRSTATAAVGGYVFRFPTPLSILKRLPRRASVL